ncbi:serine/threonine protein kinase [Polyangium jinanense]|uniref:serine/threonine-protein kinase n=1 Tax=Polyangium jinanense TaxID=2829994 RepID=UPI00233FEB62|nr:serine/threonine-protein kinase [Polyangium jinanense]MDC3953148.1 serine/threonine protein kinase [Polyangium jinanense]
MHRESSATSDALIGAVIDKRFRVVQYLGSGGVGHVYVAEGLVRGARNGPRVTVKVLRPEHQSNDMLRARFHREVAAATRISDPRVLQIHDFGTLPSDLPYFVAELLVGLDLADTLSYAGTLSPIRATRIALDTAFALAAAHTSGVVHRDVKPENIFLVHAPDGRELVKLLDFGFAWIDGDPGGPGFGAQGADGDPKPQASKESFRLTTRRGAVGTPEYMPSEQAAGELAQPTADIYALGVVLFEMLAGRPPFTGPPAVVAEKHATERPPQLRAVNAALEASTALEAVVVRSLEKDPGRRYGSAAAMAEALRDTPEGRALR